MSKQQYTLSFYLYKQCEWIERVETNKRWWEIHKPSTKLKRLSEMRWVPITRVLSENEGKWLIDMHKNNPQRFRTILRLIAEGNGESQIDGLTISTSTRPPDPVYGETEAQAFEEKDDNYIHPSERRSINTKPFNQ